MKLLSYFSCMLVGLILPSYYFEVPLCKTIGGWTWIQGFLILIWMIEDTIVDPRLTDK